MTDDRTPYPVRVDTSLDASISRGLWLVKWLLLIPHFVVLAFLWLAFVVLTVIAFFAILLTGRYPRALFDFNLGVLRWSWRVNYYGYSALGTDRYPPFTLADVPGYPAHLHVPYPEHLSRGLVLVKSWLLAIPHYLVLAVFVGGGIWLGTTRDGRDATWAAGGLVGLLVLIAGIVLLFRGRYPRPIFDFVMGMDRWALRVAAYAALMTDAYPPFRFDMGGTDPGSAPAELPPPPPAPVPATGGTPAAGTPPIDAPPVGAAAAGTLPAGPSPAGPAPSRWTAGRVIAVVVGAVLLLASTGPLAGGGALLWADRTQRSGGYVWSPRAEISTSAYAVTSDNMRLDLAGSDWFVNDVLGTARIEVTPTNAGNAVFVGIGRTADVQRYLGAVHRSVMTSMGWQWTDGRLSTGMTAEVGTGVPATPPAQAGVWEASTSGTGTQVLDWRPADGNWTVVVMRADGGPGVSAQVRVAATAPGLGWIAGTLLLVGVVLAAAGALLIALGVHRAHSGSGPGGTPAVPGPPPPVRAGPGEPVLTAPGGTAPPA